MATSMLSNASCTTSENSSVKSRADHSVAELLAHLSVSTPPAVTTSMAASVISAAPTPVYAIPASGAHNHSELSAFIAQEHDAAWASFSADELITAVKAQLSATAPDQQCHGLNAWQTMLCLEKLSLEQLTALSQWCTQHCAPQEASLCSIVNVKSGECTENCHWCAQSRHYHTGASVYGVKSGVECIPAARQCYEHGVSMFSFVASGRKQNKHELQELLTTIDEVRKQVPIKLCASLGLCRADELKTVYAHGIGRYHCNLETAGSFFAAVCTSHNQSDKLKTLEAARDCGMELCSGCILGMGESELQRIELSQQLRALQIHSIPLNFLHPIAGTPLKQQHKLSFEEIVRAVCIFRLANPQAHLRFAGGRALLTAEELHAALSAGVNATIVGNLLTTVASTSIADDREMFLQHDYILPPLPASTADANNHA